MSSMTSTNNPNDGIFRANAGGAGADAAMTNGNNKSPTASDRIAAKTTTPLNDNNGMNGSHHDNNNGQNHDNFDDIELMLGNGMIGRRIAQDIRDEMPPRMIQFIYTMDQSVDTAMMKIRICIRQVHGYMIWTMEEICTCHKTVWDDIKQVKTMDDAFGFVKKQYLVAQSNLLRKRNTQWNLLLALLGIISCITCIRSVSNANLQYEQISTTIKKLDHHEHYDHPFDNSAEDVVDLDEDHPEESSSSSTSSSTTTSTTSEDGSYFSGSKELVSLQEKIVLPAYNPFNYTLPPILELHAKHVRPYVQQRHTCLQHIREKHKEYLGPLIEQPLNAIQTYNEKNAATASSTTSTIRRKVLIVDPAWHGNVGDFLLSMGEITFLSKQYGFDTSNLINHTEIQQCGYKQHQGYTPPCKDFFAKYQSPQQEHEILQPAIWQAGGNWGDVWRMIQVPRIESFYPLIKNNFSIIGMPQSLHYKKSRNARADTKAIADNIAKGLGITGDNPGKYLDTEEGRKESMRRVTLSWREYDSYENAKKLYPFVRNVVAPDIAFQLGPYEPIFPPEGDTKMQVDILFFLRTDRESVIKKQRNANSLKQILDKIEGGKGLKINKVDWRNRMKMYNIPRENYFFNDATIKMISLGRVVVLDRLHAAITCYITGIPFVYIDQMTGKITKTLKVAFDSWDGCQDKEASWWSRATTLEDAIKQAVGFLKDGKTLY